MLERVETLHRKLTTLGAAEVKRPGPGPALVARGLSPLSEFNSSNLARLQAELGCLERRAQSVSALPAGVRRSLGRLREQVEWLVGLLPAD
jgi:hypothetical protein